MPKAQEGWGKEMAGMTGGNGDGDNTLGNTRQGLWEVP